MKYYLAILLLFFISKVSAQNASAEYFVSDISQINQIEITTAELNNLAKEYGQTASFTGLQVQKVEDHYVLLAKDQAEKWIFAFELKNEGTKLYIDIEKHINACESDNLSISVFKITDGQIDGCKKAKHRTLGRN